MGGPKTDENSAMDVLIIEDNPDDAFMVQRAVSKTGALPIKLTQAGTLAEGIAELNRNGFGAVLLDLSLPDSFGLETVTKLRAANEHVPIVVLTGQNDELVGLNAVKAGAQDYLVKGQMPPELLSRAIAYAAERKQTEEKLKANVAEKEVLLHEVHHRVKNNLQVISSLLNLQANTIASHEAKTALEEAGERVHAMASVHEKLYQQGDMAGLDFGDHLRELAGSLFHLYAGGRQSQIRLHYDLDEIRLGVDQAIPSALIVNELLVNAFKYAFPDDRTGTVTIEFKRVDSRRIRLGVSDDGIGLPPDFDWRKSRSLGMDLVQSLSTQLKATVDSAAEVGTFFRIEFPARHRADGAHAQPGSPAP